MDIKRPGEKIVILSTWESLSIVPLVKKLKEYDLPITAIINEPEFKKGKEIHYERTKGFFKFQPIYEIEFLHIPIYFVSNHNSDNCFNLLEKFEPDIIINGGTPRIIKKRILDLPKRGVINCHPGILPKYRGCTCVEWAIYNDDEVGATCHFMSEGIDEGPIIISEPMTIKRNQVYEEIRTNIHYFSFEVIAKGTKIVIEEDLDINSLPKQGKGTYHNVIPQDKLEIVKLKLKNGEYRFLID
ncbi:MAG: formyltransferase family protein [Promethearchaeota archaeon]